MQTIISVMNPLSVGMFLAYFTIGLSLWAIFNRIYLWTTPYDEHADIQAGKMAPAIALVGAEFGFMLPLLVAATYGGSLLGFVAWGILAGGVQISCFKLMHWRMPDAIETDNHAAALSFAGASVCLGIVNAFRMIP